MGRPIGTKNKMRTPEEKELIVQRYFNGESATDLTSEYNLSSKLIYRWIKKYEKNGKKGLESNTGKSSKYHKNIGLHLRKPKTREEELELKLLQKEIEIARLKKGYHTKGVGAEKEYVTIFDVNTE